MKIPYLALTALGLTSLAQAATIPGSCSTPGSCGDLVPTFQEVNVKTDLNLVDADGSNYMGIKSPAVVTADTVLTLPDGAGSNGEILTTDGSGNLSWSAIASALWTGSGSDVYFSTGKVAVGTTTPVSDLTVKSATSATGGISVVSPAGDTLAKIRSTSAARGLLELTDEAGTDVVDLRAYADAATLMMDNAAGDQKIVITSSGDSHFNAGNVGIGTATPGAVLEISGSESPSIIFDDDQGSTQRWEIGEGISTNNGELSFKELADDSQGSNVVFDITGKVGIGTTAPAHALTLDRANDSLFNITQGGVNRVLLGDTGSSDDGRMLLYNTAGTLNVNIGAEGTSYLTGADFDGLALGASAVDAPLKLDVEGKVGAIEYCNEDGTTCEDADTLLGLASGAGGAVAWESDDTNGYIKSKTSDGTADSGVVVDDSGNVGIGTTAPLDALTVSAGTTGDASAWMSVQGNRTGANLGFAGIKGYYGPTYIGLMQFVTGTDTDSGHIYFNTKDSGADGTRMAIKQDGKVGIGTVSPTQKLHVIGDGRITEGLFVGANASPTDTETLEATENYDGEGNFYQLNASGTVTGTLSSAGGSYYGGNFVITNNRGDQGANRSYAYGVRSYATNGANADASYWNAGGTFEARNNSVNGVGSLRGVSAVARQYDGVGGSTVNTSYGLDVTSMGRSGTASATSNIANARGVSSTVQAYDSNIGTAYGTYSAAHTNETYDGNITTAYGVRGYVGNHSTVGGTVGNAYGGYFSTVTSAGAIDMTTAYGVYANGSGAATNYGIYSAAGTNYFKDNVGINTTAPNSSLSIGTRIQLDRGLGTVGDGSDFWMSGNGVIASEANVYINSDANGTNSGDVVFGSGTETSAATEHMRIKEAGNVGIGTNNPSSTLDIVKNSAADNFIDVRNNAGPAGISVGYSDTAAFDIYRNSASADIFLDANQGNGKIRFQDAGVDTLTIDAAGRVGIGTDSPAAMLEVTDSVLLASEPNSQKIVHIGDPIGGTNDGYYPINFFGSAQTGWGHAYMGIDSPSGKFSLYPFSSVGKFDHFEVTMEAGGKMTVNGNVGIGQGSPLHPLHMGSGAHVTSAGVWTNASDRAYKSNIRDIEYSLEDIMSLRPVSYTHTETDTEQIGFIAQEVETVIPELVSGEDGEKGMSYGQMTAALTKAVQEIKNEKDNEVALLQSEIELLKQQINLLKTQ